MAQVQFPSSPTDGDLYTVNNVTYTWDNTAGLWEANNATALADTFVEVAGDTMTGSLIPAATGQSGYISRTGTTLSPSDTGDSVDIGSGNITLNADGSARFIGASNVGNTRDATSTSRYGVWSTFQDSFANGAGILDIYSTTTANKTLPSFRILEGTTEIIRFDHDGTSYFDGDMNIGGTLPSSPNIQLLEDGQIYSRNVIRGSAAGETGYAATVAGFNGSIAANATSAVIALGANVFHATGFLSITCTHQSTSFQKTSRLYHYSSTFTAQSSAFTQIGSAINGPTSGVSWSVSATTGGITIRNNETGHGLKYSVAFFGS